MQDARGRRIGMYAKGGLCLAAALLSLAGCGEARSKRSALTEPEIKRLTLAQQPDRPDRLVVSGETITWEDILAFLPDDGPTPMSLKANLEKSARESSLNRFLEEHRLVVHQRLVNRISSIVLSKRVARDLGDKADEKLTELAQQELRRFTLEEHGGDGAAADEALRRMGMSRVTYVQWKKKEILARDLLRSKYLRNRPITYRELQARYDEMKDRHFAREEVLQLRLIDIDVARVRAEHPNEDPQQRAKDLRQRIDAGEDFSKLAKEHSHGLRSEQGGLWRPRDPAALAPPYDVLARTAQKMQPGEVAGPIAAPGHFFIMKVEDRQERGYRPLSEVQEEVRRDILQQRLREVSDDIDAEIRRQADLADTSRFVEYCLTRFYQQTRGMD